MQDKTFNHDILVVYFPCKFNNDTICEENSKLLDQLERIKLLQTCWADQAVSNTVYYQPNDVPLIQEWLSKNYDDSVKTISFLRHSGHGFEQAVLMPISKEEYINYDKNLKSIQNQNHNLEGEMIDSAECSGGSCPIR